MVAPPTDVHEFPSAETKAEIVEPLRQSASQVGGRPLAPASHVVERPVALRAMNSMLPDGSTSRITFAAPAVSESRNMTPAFALPLVFWREFALAIISPSPLSG